MRPGPAAAFLYHELVISRSGAMLPAAADTVRLPETLFSELGFSSVQIASGGDITVPDGATITQLPRSVDVTDAARFGSGTSIADMGPLVVLPLSQRVDLTPTSLSLTGRNVTIGAGATVATDVGGSITVGGSEQYGRRRDQDRRPAGGAGREDQRLGRAGTVTVASTAALVANGVPRHRNGWPRTAGWRRARRRLGDLRCGFYRSANRAR